MARGATPGQIAQQTKGLIPGTKFYSCFPFAGVNLNASPIAMDDKEFIWVENFVRLGDGKLRTIWDAGTPLYRAPPNLTIINYWFYNIASVYYVAVFLSDGSAVQVNTTDAVQTQIGGPGLFFKAGGDPPGAAQWGILYLLMCNRNTVNDYWAWDGSILYQAGTAAPEGVNLISGGSSYSSDPTLTVYGGHGLGMVITPTVNDGSVVEMNIVNPGSGYEIGDIVQVGFSGGGSDTSAILVALLAAGGVAAVNVTAPGSGYATPPSVVFTGGGGSGAAGTAIIGTGVTGFTITNPGSGYTGANVAISGGGGTGATATAIVNGGQVVAINVVDAGTGYTSIPTVTITGDGTLAAANAIIQGGIVTGVTMTSPGTGYTSAPNVAFTGGGGSGALGQAVLTGTTVNTVQVVNPGSGYTYPPTLTFEGGGGIGAAAVAILTPTSISHINVTSNGQFYTDTPVVKVWAPGQTTSPASAVAVMSGGTVVAVTLTNAGSGYITPPFIQIFAANDDKTGGGATAVAVLTPTTIASVVMSNYGSGYTDAPAVLITPGANNAAAATVTMMPFGVSGSGIETYQSRAWIVNPAQGQFTTIPPGGDFSVSAPGSFVDFATSDGGVIFTNSDNFLQTKFTNVRQSNGYLYFFGDGSASVVSNIQSTGNPTVTTFNYQNVDPQAGLSWRDSLQSFSKTLLAANETGVYGLYGGALTPVAKKLDDLFDNALFPPTAGALTPSSAISTIHNVRHYHLLMTATDPVLNTVRNVMITWNEREWTIASQTPNLIRIATQKIASKFTAWGTDGSALYPLFSTPSATLTKRIDTKFYGSPQTFMLKQLDGLYLQAQDKSNGQVGVVLNVNFVVTGQGIQNADTPSVPSGIAEMLTQPDFPAPEPYFNSFAALAGDLPFVNIGAEITSTSPDFVLGNLLLSYLEVAADR